MRFEIRHEFDAPMSKVEEAMQSPEYFPFLLEKHGVLLELEPLDRTEENGRVRRRVRYLPRPVIEKVGPKKVPAHWFGFTEESTFDTQRHELTFRNVPTTNTIAKMLVNQGKVVLREVGPNRTERVTSGELRLELPFLLRPLAVIGERVIHSEAVKLLDGEARVMTEWLKRS